ncbi:MAG: PIN domain-containing protein [Deltaproteobacteria bacterium]|nr:PIN domain-containing protein [Deltaproteobacteria bacterium]
MGILIDTSVLIADERGRLDLDSWLAVRQDETFAISAITLSELWAGVHRAAKGPRRTAREGYVLGVREDYPVLPFDAAVAEVHAMLVADLARRGSLIGAHDLIIAATAVAGSLAVATLNLKEFRRVKGLEVVALQRQG